MKNNVAALALSLAAVFAPLSQAHASLTPISELYKEGVSVEDRSRHVMDRLARLSVAFEQRNDPRKGCINDKFFSDEPDFNRLRELQRTIHSAYMNGRGNLNVEQVILHVVNQHCLPPEDTASSAPDDD